MTVNLDHTQPVQELYSEIKKEMYLQTKHKSNPVFHAFPKISQNYFFGLFEQVWANSLKIVASLQSFLRGPSVKINKIQQTAPDRLQTGHPMYFGHVQAHPITATKKDCIKL